MSIEFAEPDEDILRDLESLEIVIRNDSDGFRSRQLKNYCNEMEQFMSQARLRATDYEDQITAGVLMEAFAAGARVIGLAWTRLHGRELI